MKHPSIHIIHVGSVTNKGTYVLLKSEIAELEKLSKDPKISVSTTDIDALKRLEPTLIACPPLVDIPYERADVEARRHNHDRGDLMYKFYLLIYTLLMVLQPFLSIAASALSKINVRTFRRETIKRLAGSDLIVSTADENFKEGSSNLPFNVYWKLAWWSMLFSRMWDIIVSKKLFKKPIVIFPNSVGPFRTKIGRFMAKIALNNVDSILLREPYSQKSLSDLRIRTPTTITSDVALLFEAGQAKLSQSLPKPVVGVSPGFYTASFSEDKQQKYITALCKTLDCLIMETGVNVIFMPHSVTGLKGDDYSICKVILRNMKQKDKARIVNAKTLDDFKNYLRQLDLLISSRMHPTVLACSDNVPAVAIFYDHKQTGFFNQLGLDRCTIDINLVSFENLMPEIRFAWSNREKIRERLSLRIPLLQNDVKMKIRGVCQNFLIRNSYRG